MRILFLGSNPDDTSKLRLDREYRTIDLHLQEGGDGERLELQSAWAVRIGDLSRELLRWKPSIVHFSGHGSPGGLVFEGEDGIARIAPVVPLADLFRIVEGVRGVVLNACYSWPQADAIRRDVEFVVGTSDRITDNGAIAFASGFYRGLSFGLDWQKCVDLGRAEIGLRDLPDSPIIHSAAGKTRG
jgi:hypothetical protein